MGRRGGRRQVFFMEPMIRKRQLVKEPFPRVVYSMVTEVRPDGGRKPVVMSSVTPPVLLGGPG